MEGRVNLKKYKLCTKTLASYKKDRPKTYEALKRYFLEENDLVFNSKSRTREGEFMNEFIVWNEEKKEFSKEFLTNYDGDIIYRNVSLDNNTHKRFNYIGKTDINDKKIYADSSIVEFDYKGFEEIGTVTYKAIVKFDNVLGCYFFDVFSHADNNGYNYNFLFPTVIYRVRNLKIIGTLQEDKHLLGDS